MRRPQLVISSRRVCDVLKAVSTTFLHWAHLVGQRACISLIRCLHLSPGDSRRVLKPDPVLKLGAASSPKTGLTKLH